MRILGIETSCDETGIAIYDDVDSMVANLVYSQVDKADQNPLKSTPLPTPPVLV